MVWLRPYIAVFTVYCMTPGAVEVIENVIHVTQNGHTAHAFDDDYHTPQGVEHGCAGTLHVCSCCQTPVFVRPRIAATVSIGLEANWGSMPEADDLASDGYLTGVFRPPIV